MNVLQSEQDEVANSDAPSTDLVLQSTPIILSNDDIIRKIQAELVLDPSKHITIWDVIGMIDIDQNLASLIHFAKEHLGLSRAEVFRAVNKQRIKEALGFYPDDVEDYVSKQLAKTGFDVSYQGAFTLSSDKLVLYGVPVTEKSRKDPLVDAYVRIKHEGHHASHHVMERLFLDAQRVGLDYNTTLINAALSQYKDRRKREIWLNTYSDINYDGAWPESEEQWLSFGNALCAGSDTKVELAIAVMKKFVWQVKRKMLSLPITDHLMPVLTGPQGIGKSTVIRDLFCGPVSTVLQGTDFGGIEEAKNFELWDNFVLFFDEMGKAAKTDIETIKKRITDPVISSRILTTHQSGIQPNRATFIGCCNEELSQVIMDKTGVRRFFPIHTTHEMRAQWETLGKINWNLLWKSVNERGDDPTKAFYKEIWAVQEEERTLSLPEEWARWAYEQRGGKASKNWVLLSDLYNDAASDTCFIAYQQKFNPDGRSWSLNNFGKEITRICRSLGEAFPLEKNSTRTSQGFKYRWRASTVDQVDMVVKAQEG